MKTERQGAPVFKFVVEVLAQNQWRVHRHVDSSVDTLLAGSSPNTQLRMHRKGKLVVRFETAAADPPALKSKVSETESFWLTSLGKLANHKGSAV